MASISEIIESYRLRKASEAEAAARIPGLPRMPNPKIIPAASVNDVLWEQFSEVMAAQGADPRYLAIRAILLEVFDERTEDRAMGASA